MSWGRPGKGGWGREAGDGEAGGWLRQVIHTVLEVVAGGVIRAGKTAYDDDAHAGFWLGVGADGVARFNLGGPTHWLKWTGTALTVQGFFRTDTVVIDGDGLAIRQGDATANQLRFVDEEGDALGVIEVTAGPWLQIVTGQGEQPGDTARIDLWVDGDLGASAALRIETVKGGGPGSSGILFIFGQQTRASVDATGKVTARGGLDAQGQRVTNVGAAQGAGDALSLGTGDARYVGRAAGWSGAFRTDEIATVTVVDGQITAVG